MKYLVLLSILFIISCETPTSPDISILSGDKTIIQYGESLFPMTVGNVWEYEYKHYKNDTLTNKGERRHEIITHFEIELNGKIKNCYGLEEKGTDNSHMINPISHYYYIYDSDGIYLYGSQISDFPITTFNNIPQLTAIPVSKNQKWTYLNEENVVIDVLCESTDEIYNVNGNEIHCVKIVASINGFIQYINYYAKGIGLVRHLSYDKFNKNMINFEYSLVHNKIL